MIKHNPAREALDLSTKGRKGISKKMQDLVNMYHKERQEYVWKQMLRTWIKRGRI